jgi:predicted P-loop ATPase
MLVLEGPQGIGKTNSLRTLAGAHLHAEITLAVTRDGVMDLHGPWVVEWSELSGLSRAELESVKALISRRVDRIRLPYARTVVELPRRCVMAGTTNEEGWASDTTGNRRYWPVRVGACDTEALARVREQIWAEARVAYQAGGQWWLDQNETLLAAQEQAARVPEDPWLAELLDLVEGTYKGDQWVTSATLLEALGVPQTARTTAMGRRLAIQMRALGFGSGRRWIGGHLVRVWVRPLVPEPEEPDGICVGPEAKVIHLVQPPLCIDTKSITTVPDIPDRSHIERERERE